MREVMKELLEWWDAGETVGVGTVVATFRSAPRPPGASMVVGPDGTAVGSVSGGCVEGAVYEAAQEAAGSGEPSLHRYGISDEDAFAVGLTCGGILDVYVEQISKQTFPELGALAAEIEAGQPVALARVVEHPDKDWVGRRAIVRPGGSTVTSSSSAKSSTASTCAARPSTRSRHAATCLDKAPPAIAIAARRCSSVSAERRSASPSASARSIRPLAKARRVNSPASALRRPGSAASARSTAATTARPP